LYHIRFCDRRLAFVLLSICAIDSRLPLQTIEIPPLQSYRLRLLFEANIHVMAIARPQASVLFAPFELRLYLRWRSQQPDVDTADTTPPVPNAYEYAAFQTWRAQERIRVLPQSYITNVPDGSTELQDVPIPEDCAVAQICGHALHPATTTRDSSDISHCAVCTYSIHTSLITAISKKWKALGGPWRVADSADNAERNAYNHTNRAYHTAKCALIIAMQYIEDKAALEDSWHEPYHIANAHSAVKALQMYKGSINFPSTSGVAPHTPLSTPAKRRSKEKKRIVYSPDVPETTKHRPPTLWSRATSSHDPDSPHACPSDEGYWDTSHYNDWRFSISQCRILLCSYPSDESLKLEYVDLNTSPNRGMDNPPVQHLIVLLERYISKKSGAKQARWYAYLQGTSDIFLVWRSEGDEELFSLWEKVGGLVGSHVEEYAREIGEIDDDEEEVEIEDDRSDRADYGESEDEVEEIEVPDSMELEEYEGEEDALEDVESVNSVESEESWD
jgi:hypothetical protein